MEKSGMKSITLCQYGKTVTFYKEEIIKSFEQDWDDDKIYYKIDSDGKVTKINIQTWDIYEYVIDKAVH